MNTQANIADPDGFYEALLDAHAGLNDDQSVEFNARLILLLANQIGDQTVLLECVRAAANQWANQCKSMGSDSIDFD